MGQLDYILQGMVGAKAGENREKDDDSKQQLERIASQINQSLAQLNQRMDAIEQRYTAQLQNVGMGLGGAIKSIETATSNAVQAHLQSSDGKTGQAIQTYLERLDKASKELTATIKQETGKLEKPDRSGEVIKAINKAVSGVNNKDVLSAIRDMELHTLLALKNIPEPQMDLKPLTTKINSLEKKIQKPKEWVFDVEHDIVGDITKVVAREQT